MGENVMNTAAAAAEGFVPTIEIAAHAGTCYGVQRALDMALAAAPQAGESAQVHTLGPLIHNPIVVRELAEAGVGLAETLDDATSGTVIIRAHGVVPQVIDAARERGLTVVDATWPYVKKVHVAAERLVREGYRVIVVGEPGHPEVEGILGHAGDDAQVVSCAADADELSLKGKVGLVVQTTQTAQNLAEVVASITPRVQELRVINTICAATSERQQAAATLANRCDCMVVVGGKNSGNTRRLAQISASTRITSRKLPSLRPRGLPTRATSASLPEPPPRKNTSNAPLRASRSFAANHGPDRTRIRRRGGRLRAQPRPRAG